MFERGRKDPETSSESQASDSSTWSNRAASSSSSGSAPGEAAVIGRSIKIKGDLRGEEDLRIEGDVSGTVELRNSTLTIGKEGRIKADVYAKAVFVDGYMEGDLYASERVNVRATAHVLGNVTSPRVSLEDGAKFKGAVEMDPEAVKRALGHTGSNSAIKPSQPKQASDQKMNPAIKEAAAT
jgi:cytoskeletal protein CcmA (bactofilin family)